MYAARLKLKSLGAALLSNVDPASPPAPVIFGLSGSVLTAQERSFFKSANPLGFILFSRNIETPDRLLALTNSLRDLMGRNVPILIDQEGGRVQRLGPPHWNKYNPFRFFGDMFAENESGAIDALKKSNESIAADLTDLGINVNCTPVMDIAFPQTHAIIGDRSFGSNPAMVGRLGGCVARAHAEHGVVPIMKHIPGHGRATADSHENLPVVDAPLEELEKTDFVPFQDILSKPFSEAMWGMTAHIIYKHIDASAPATCSRRVIWDVIRGKIGFQGLLLSDDIGMKALDSYGEMSHRAEKALRAGCDIVLHCSGNLPEMESVMSRVGPMTEDAVKRYNNSVRWVRRNKK